MQEQSTPLILLTRPEPAASRFAQELRSAGIEAAIHIAPLMALRWYDLPILSEGDALLISSRNVADHLPAAYVAGREAYVVGEASAAILAAKGAHIVETAASGGALAERLNAQHSCRTLHWLHGNRIAFDFRQSAWASAANHSIIAHAIYQANGLAFSEADLAALCAAKSLLIPVFSPHSAGLLMANLPGDLPSTRLVALSGAVAQALLPPPGPVWVASQPDAAEMITLLLELSAR